MSALLCSPDEKAALEARNGLVQLDFIQYLAVDRERESVFLRESHLLELQRIAIDGIYPCGGHYRDAVKTVHIRGSTHQVPHPSRIRGLVLDCLDIINRPVLHPVYRAGYAMWRFNWIHPFAGGNGRTARAMAYLVICMDWGAMPPGVPSLTSLICNDKAGYIRCLHAADDGDSLAPMEFLNDLLTKQLEAGALSTPVGEDG